MKEKYILATDLDGTLVGNKSAIEELFRYLNEQYIDLQLVFITGRHLQSAQHLIKEEELPTPDILICDVGSSIYFKSNNHRYTEDKEWKKMNEINWSPEDVLKVVKGQELQLQSGIPLSKRISFRVNNEQKVKQVCQRLAQSGIAHKVIYSSGKDLDILPENSGKGNALTYVLQKYYKNNKSVLIAGNSGNDLEMLSLGYPSVIVGNAEKELQGIENTPFLYRARGHYARGIKEAWESFFQD